MLQLLLFLLLLLLLLLRLFKARRRAKWVSRSQGWRIATARHEKF